MARGRLRAWLYLELKENRLLRRIRLGTTDPILPPPPPPPYVVITDPVVITPPPPPPTYTNPGGVVKPVKEVKIDTGIKPPKQKSTISQTNPYIAVTPTEIQVAEVPGTADYTISLASIGEQDATSLAIEYEFSTTQSIEGGLSHKLTVNGKVVKTTATSAGVEEILRDDASYLGGTDPFVGELSYLRVKEDGFQTLAAAYPASVFNQNPALTGTVVDAPTPDFEVTMTGDVIVTMAGEPILIAA